MSEDKLVKAQKLLKINFSNQKLLKQALTHPSYLSESEKNDTYERLEFLGDAVLNLVITDFLFRRFPQFEEGSLAKLRANLVNADQLAEIARELGLSDCLYIGKAVEQQGRERQRKSILGDCLEAVLGAIYLDQELKVVKAFILGTFKDVIFEEASKSEFSDFKTALQEYTLSKLGVFPEYRIVAERGPVHDKTFFAEVRIEGRVWGKGDGTSKKRAELASAAEALGALKSLKKAEKP